MRTWRPERAIAEDKEGRCDSINLTEVGNNIDVMVSCFSFDIV
jgi:hypothetical protein